MWSSIHIKTRITAFWKQVNIKPINVKNIIKQFQFPPYNSLAIIASYVIKASIEAHYETARVT